MTYEPDPDLLSVATAGGDPDEPAVLLLPEHLATIAAFVRSQRAVGWREAIEALRDDNRFEAWACDLPADEYARYDKAVSVSFDAILAYLESLAPKETP